ncbi:hypothetical protein NWUPM366V_132 [Escherichia phage vB_EcoM_366V_SA_NWU]|nr:hypothetical protein NWUPM12A_151 [Escherichia phage vB_EcoM_12A_SA_NWU]WIL79707.1 hypothetical protein NWUPM366V_132 [Escherichia phage vB_EcoM_366V_SA_NWU]
MVAEGGGGVSCIFNLYIMYTPVNQFHLNLFTTQSGLKQILPIKPELFIENTTTPLKSLILHTNLTDIQPPYLTYL